MNVMLDEKTVSRRTALKGLCGLAVAGAGAAAIGTSPAGASANGETEVDGAVAVATDDGSYQYVHKASATHVAWDGFNEPARYVTFETTLDVEGVPDEHQLYGPTTIALEDLADGSRGGSLDHSTGEGTRGELHTGVGDHEPLGGYEHGDLEPQSEDSRWPIVVRDDYDGDLYGVPDPWEDSAEGGVLSAYENGGETVTTLGLDTTVFIHAEKATSPDDLANFDSAAVVELGGVFEVTVENIESGADAEGSDSNVDVEVDDDKTGE